MRFERFPHCRGVASWPKNQMFFCVTGRKNMEPRRGTQRSQDVKHRRIRRNGSGRRVVGVVFVLDAVRQLVGVMCRNSGDARTCSSKMGGEL